MVSSSIAPSPTEIYPLSLHDALPICGPHLRHPEPGWLGPEPALPCGVVPGRDRGRLPPRRDLHRTPEARSRADRKSTRLNSSHTVISYAVFCLKKKNNKLWTV